MYSGNYFPVSGEWYLSIDYEERYRALRWTCGISNKFMGKEKRGVERIETTIPLGSGQDNTTNWVVRQKRGTFASTNHHLCNVLFSILPQPFGDKMEQPTKPL